MDTLPPHAQDGNTCYVYELVDPREMSIFYVGITINLYARFKQHMYCDGANLQKDARIQEIVASGHLPIMRTLEQVTQENARKREEWWIWHYRVKRFQLLNIKVPLMKYRALKKTRTKPVRSISWNTKSRNLSSVVEMLISVRESREWPANISKQMQRYYRREYPEFFHNGKKWERLREEQKRKASRIEQERSMRYEPRT